MAHFAVSHNNNYQFCEMKIYEAKLKKGTEVESFSLVLNAAVQTKLSKFSEEIEKPTFFANEEKRIIYSVALRPDKMIFRKDVNGEPANVFFSKETVEEIQQSYFLSNNKGLVKMNLNHSDEKVEGVYPIESWIVENPEIDKSKTLLMEDVKANDLIIGYKIDNDDVWENFIKTGEVDGLSVEAYLDYEIIKPNIDMNTKDKESFFSHMMSFFAGEPATPASDAATPASEPKVEDPKAEDERFAEMQKQIDSLRKDFNDMQAKEVGEDSPLATMKREFATFKAETVAIKNVPNEPTKKFEEMNNFEKLKFNREK